MKAYLKRDIAKKLGKTPKTIQTWTDIGLVNADLRSSQGKGISRVYSSLNLLQFAFVDELRKCRGISIAGIKVIMDKLRSQTTDEASFRQAIERNQDGDLLFCDIEGSHACLTVNLSMVFENTKVRLS